MKPAASFSDNAEFVDHNITDWSVDVKLADKRRYDSACIEIEDLSGTAWAITVREHNGRITTFDSFDIHKLTIDLVRGAEVRNFADGFRWLADRLTMAAEAMDKWRASSQPVEPMPTTAIETDVFPSLLGGQ